MSNELYAIFGVGFTQIAGLIAIAGLGLRANRGLRNNLKDDMRDMENRIRAEAKQAHEAIGENIGIVREDLKALRGEIKGEITVLRSEMRDDIRGLNDNVKELNRRIGIIEGRNQTEEG